MLFFVLNCGTLWFVALLRDKKVWSTITPPTGLLSKVKPSSFLYWQQQPCWITISEFFSCQFLLKFVILIQCHGLDWTPLHEALKLPGSSLSPATIRQNLVFSTFLFMLDGICNTVWNVKILIEIS